MFPLEGVVFPGTGTMLHVFEPRYLDLVDRVLATDNRFGTVLIERGSEVGGGDVRLNTGSMVELIDHLRLPDGRCRITVVAMERIAVHRWLPDDPHPWAEVRSWPDANEEGEPDITGVWERIRRVAEFVSDRPVDERPDLAADIGPVLASFQLSALSPLGPLDRYRLLEAPGPISRLRMTAEMLDEQIEILESGMGSS